MTCENLATKAELAALEQRLTALLSVKLDKGEKQAIIEAGGHQGFKLSEASLGPQILTALGIAGAAKALGDNALGEAKNASSQVYQVRTIAEDAGAAARRAEAEAYLAKLKTNKFEGLLGQLRLKLTNLDMFLNRLTSRFSALEGLVNVLRGSLNGVSRAINGLQSSINRLFGLIRAIDDRFGGLLGKVASLTGKVLNILNAIATITSLVATMASLVQLYRLTQQVNALEQKVSLQGTVIQGILALVKNIQSQLSGVSGVANDALNRAIQALGQSAQSLSQSSSAISQSQSAINTALNAAKQAAIAIATATAVTAIANAAMNRANQAWDLANRAFNSAKGAGRTIIQRFTTNNTIDRTVTRVEQRNFIERIEGKPGKDGKDGIPGRDGRDGKDMNPADLGEIKRLLYRIDGTTTSNQVMTSIVMSDTTQVVAKTGRIESVLNGLNNFTQKAFRATRMDKVLNALNTVLLFHNAAMLSRNLAVTLGDTASTVLNAFGVRDENDQPLDVNAVLGKKFTELAVTVLGKEVYEDLSDKWKAASRILASASRMLDIIKSMIYSVINGLEVIGRWIALIGNGAQRDGLFSDGMFPWANENPNFKNPFFNYVEKLERLEDAASSINELASEVVEGKELIEEFRKEKKTFNEELDKGAKELTLKEEEEVKKSENPAIKDEDLLEAQDDD